MYKNITEWWNCKKPELYDFREQIITFMDEDDSIDRFMIYQAIGVAMDGGYITPIANAANAIYNSYENLILFPKDEADTCPLIQQIYEKLWDNKHFSFCLRSGDTMNSCITTLKELIKKELKLGSLSKGRMVQKYYDEQQRKSLFKKTLEEYEGVEDYLKVAYTIGNFIPVPFERKGKEFNSPRGFNNRKIEDYWDLTLWNIYQWYAAQGIGKVEEISDPDKLLYVIVKNKDSVDLCKEWLSSFCDDEGHPSWDHFVIANYMQDFVDDADPAVDSGRFGRPKEFWLGHFEGAVLPEGTQFEEFFRNAADRIKARSVRMVSALRAKGDSE